MDYTLHCYLFSFHSANTIRCLMKGSHDIYNYQTEKKFNKLLTSFALGGTVTQSLSFSLNDSTYQTIKVPKFLKVTVVLQTWFVFQHRKCASYCRVLVNPFIIWLFATLIQFQKTMITNDMISFVSPSPQNYFDSYHHKTSNCVRCFCCSLHLCVVTVIWVCLLFKYY